MKLLDRLEVGLLTLCGLILGVISVFYLNLLIGSVPAPVTVILAAAGNVVLLKRAAELTASAWRYAPVIAWTLVVLTATLPGVSGNGALIGDWRVLLLLVSGLGACALANSMARLDEL
ncbi:hypothetical protein [Gordonia zhaorongruii]|uniref:hypothetical protein n=1 Tax=Gordonia zhaorongruii TaxID=2597659 RepID=UPI00104306B1|nr:hypothetical protein [Gordonia zhaorongruii]